MIDNKKLLERETKKNTGLLQDLDLSSEEKILMKEIYSYTRIKKIKSFNKFLKLSDRIKIKLIDFSISLADNIEDAQKKEKLVNKIYQETKKISQSSSVKGKILNIKKINEIRQKTNKELNNIYKKEKFLTLTQKIKVSTINTLISAINSSTLGVNQNLQLNKNILNHLRKINNELSNKSALRA